MSSDNIFTGDPDDIERRLLAAGPKLSAADSGPAMWDRSSWPSIQRRQVAPTNKRTDPNINITTKQWAQDGSVSEYRYSSPKPGEH